MKLQAFWMQIHNLDMEYICLHEFKLEHISQIFDETLISSRIWKWNIGEIFKIPNEMESSCARRYSGASFQYNSNETIGCEEKFYGNPASIPFT